jgi:hypothetical protein
MGGEKMHEVDSGLTIRVLHNMARSGGTLISRCIGCMQSVILLSEIHPAGIKYFNPLAQAHHWFGLLTGGDLGDVAKSGGVSFNDGIEIIAKRCRNNAQTLVLRDWSHLDYTAVPFLHAPTYESALSDTLRHRFRVVDAATVRHPVDQWLSLSRLPIMQNKINLDTFLRGYLRFAEYSSWVGFIRFEDFLQDPDSNLAVLCKRLEIDFDPSYIDRWSSYRTITGDQIKQDRGKERIRASSPRSYESSLLDTVYRNSDYQASIKLLGYSHPVCDE